MNIGIAAGKVRWNERLWDEEAGASIGGIKRM